MAQKKETKKEDQRLKEELKNADIGKFKKLLKRVLAPTKKPLKKSI